ncbi:16134_t:CDS:2, partial [Racocetra fulgida]
YPNQEYISISINENNINDQNIFINQAEEYMKDFSKPANLIGFKQLVDDFEIELPEEVLINALELLSDDCLFKGHTKRTMIRLEIHLRTLMATLERACYFPIVLRREIREQLYKNLRNFIDIHYNVTNIFKKGVGGVSSGFKHKQKSKATPNSDDIYMHFRNYDIDFLLIHLRDTLHSMRNDETRMQEILRHIKELLLAFLHIPPTAAAVALGNIPSALGVVDILSSLVKVFDFKYPITYWYPTIDQTHQGKNLNDQTEFLEFLNIWTKKEPTAPPNSLWFGVLDLAQSLSLESLQKSKCIYICFKSLELLLLLSHQKPEWFKDIVQEEINKYRESLSITSQQNLDNLIHDVNLKIQLNIEFTKQSSLQRAEIQVDKKFNSLLEIVIDQLTCPITVQITGDFFILTCGHSISNYAINEWKKRSEIENKIFECPICKSEIKLESTFSFPKNATLKGLYEKLEQAGYFNKLSEEQLSANNLHIADDDLFLKFNKVKIFRDSIISRLPSPIFQKVRPKITLPAFNKAAKAELHDYMG